MYDKYSERYSECDYEWNKAYEELKNNNLNKERREELTERISALNIQLSTYECIVRDLKEYINETSR
jgi:hypothetical protein